MRNPIHKRLENLATWQHLTFMACLCERMYPNYHLFCQISEQPQNAKVYHNILNLVWEYLTVKDTKINFENQLEKFEDIIPDVNDYQCYGVIPALDACEGLSEVLHTIIAGASLEPTFFRDGCGLFGNGTRARIVRHRIERIGSDSAGIGPAMATLPCAE